jgi:hypothetical protein
MASSTHCEAWQKSMHGAEYQTPLEVFTAHITESVRINLNLG